MEKRGYQTDNPDRLTTWDNSKNTQDFRVTLEACPRRFNTMLKRRAPKQGGLTP